MEKKLDEMTDEEKTKFFEEHLSPLIRYGYQEAIDELIEFVATDKTMIEIYDKLTSMMDNKRQVNWPKLQNEALSGQEKIKVDKSDTLSNEEPNSGQLQQHNVSGSVCDHTHLLWINSDWKYFCLDCGEVNITN